MIKQALILVGGYGTRLRPISLVIPKPLIPILNKSLLEYHIDNFIKCGLREIVFCISYRAETVKRKIKALKKNADFVFVNEKKPLGTGGAIKNAARFLKDDFLAINGDIFSDFNLPALLRDYNRFSPEMLIGTRCVDNPSKFGLLKMNAKRRVLEFLEKPSAEFSPGGSGGRNEINAGIYILNKKLISDYPMKEFSIERNFFPETLKKVCHIYGFRVMSYWNDVGTPEEYLNTSFYCLGRTKKNLYTGKAVRLGSGVIFSGKNIIMDGVKLGDNTELENSILMEGVEIGPDSKIKNCILSPGARAGRAVSLKGMVLGAGSYLDDFSFLNGSLL